MSSGAIELCFLLKSSKWSMPVNSLLKTWDALLLAHDRHVSLFSISTRQISECYVRSVIRA